MKFMNKVNRFMNKVNRFLGNLSLPKFIITMTLCTFFCSVMLGLVCYIFNIEDSISKTDLATLNSISISMFIQVVLLAPLVETLIFQYATINFLRSFKMFKNNNLIIISISAIFFGLAHAYSLNYIINATCMGIFFAYPFIIYEKKERSPYWTACIIHSLRNLFSFIFMCIFTTLHIF